MRVKYANKVFQVLYTKEVAGLTLYAVEDEPNHVDWLVNVEVIDFEKKELKKINKQHLISNYFNAEYERGKSDALKSVAWDEEDEKRLQSCLNILQARGIMEVAETVNSKWLKSLKDRVQPKLEWSEEDKNMLNGIIEASTHHCYLNITDIDWLKSLKERVQPKQEWSEKDEHWRQKAIDFMKHPGLIKATPTLAKDTIDWLKSLRPQSHWKPSDEQIDMLKIAVSTSNSIVLDSLYNDLKKLKE